LFNYITISKDCRPEEEYVVSHIAGAVRVDYKNDAEKILEKLPSKGNYYIPGAVRVYYQNDAQKILEKLPSKGNYYYIPGAVRVYYQKKHRRSWRNYQVKVIIIYQGL
jgi:hypothetical protein